MNKQHLTPEHLRYAKVEQLARLFRTTKAVISRWNTASFHDRTLNRAVQEGVPKELLIQGIELRRGEVKLAKKYQEEFEEFLLQSEQEDEE